MANTQRLLNKQSVKAIMNGRVTAPADKDGKTVSLTIQGNGNVIDVVNRDGELVQSAVEPGTVFQKKIFNTKANSGIAMSSTATRALYMEGVKAEAAGNAELAHQKYNEFLNSVQLSFSVPTTSAIVDRLANGVEIAAKLQKITTERGSLLTIDPATIRIMEPEALGKTTFAFDEEFESAPVEEVSELKA